jgi:hypothetical protein
MAAGATAGSLAHQFSGGVYDPTKSRAVIQSPGLALLDVDTNASIWTSMELQVRWAIAAEALACFGRGKSELRRAVCRITSGI